MQLDRRLLDDLLRRVVGRRREVEVLVAALAAGRHVLLEGPPGTGKSTLLRALAGSAGIGFEFVEGTAELTPTRLIGSYDPSRVLAEGYTEAIWVDGPLAAAMRTGGLLYVEEINRVPEETLNVLITVMSEGELHVPRLGRIVAADGFRLVAAMNPFDAVGTARISSAVYDRTCRLRMDYQDALDEVEILRRSAAAVPVSPDERERVVRLVRLTRGHPDVRVGSSVRGAIDMVLVAWPLAGLRGVPPGDREVSLDAALTALSGRIRLHDGSGRSAEDVVRDLWTQVYGVEPADEDADPADPPDPPDPADEPKPDSGGGAGKAHRPGAPADLGSRRPA